MCAVLSADSNVSIVCCVCGVVSWL